MARGKHASICILILLLVSSWVLESCSAWGSLPPALTEEPTTASGQAAQNQVTSTSRPARLRTPTPSPLPLTAVPTLNVNPARLQGLSIQFWHPYSGDAQVLLALMIAEFNQTNRWGIKVQEVPLAGWGVLEERLEAAMQKGPLPDLLPGYNFQALHWDIGGDVVDLNPYVDDPRWGLSAEEQKDFYPLWWAQDLIRSAALPGKPVGGEKRVGLPWYRSGLLIFYNRTWAGELGYPSPPATAGEFQAQACAAAKAVENDKDRSNDGTGGWLVTPEPAVLASWIFAFGGELSRPDDKGYQFDTPQALRAFQFIDQMRLGGCAWLADDLHPYDQFAGRRALFMAGDLAGLSAIRAALRQAGNPDEWDVLPFPAGDGSPAFDAYGPSLVVLKSTPERQLAAWLFASWLANPLNQSRWAQSNAFLPVRAEAQTLAGGSPARLPQWEQALELIPDAHSEPVYASWSSVRWTLGDALAQLFLPDFKTEQIPGLLRELDQLAAEMHTQIR